MLDLTLRGLLSNVETEKVVLPAMQRPFVWSEDRIIRLIDSLLRGFPIGAVLLWRTRTLQRFRRFQREIQSGEAPVFNFEQAEAADDRYMVLDGQQRLTSLLVALRGRYDDKRFYVDVLSGPNPDKDPGSVYYDGQFLTQAEAQALNAEPAANGRYFQPLEKLTELDPAMAPEVAFDKAQALALNADQRMRMSKTYLRCAALLGSHKALQAHLIDDDQVGATPVEEILEVFVRVNSGGLVLQKSDLLMSLLDLKWNDIQPQLQLIVRDLNAGRPYNFTRDDVLKTLLLAVGSDTRFDRLVADRHKVEELGALMPARVPAVEKAWKTLAILLNDDARIYSERFFRGGHNSLLPFAYHLALNPNPSPGQKKELVTGIYIAIMSGVFAGAEARMGRFAREKVKAGAPFPLQALGRLVAGTGWRSLESLLQKHLDMALNIAHNGISLDRNPDELQRDHIFPRSTLADAGWPWDKVNHYANFHFLRASDNLNKSNLPPDQWFRSPGRDAEPYSDRDLDERLLSWDLLEPGAFEKLLEVRSVRIKKQAEGLFGRSVEEFDRLFA